MAGSAKGCSLNISSLALDIYVKNNDNSDTKYNPGLFM